MHVPRVEHGDAAREVDVAAAFDIPKLRVGGALGVHGKRVGHSARHGGLAAFMKIGIRGQEDLLAYASRSSTMPVLCRGQVLSNTVLCNCPRLALTPPLRPKSSSSAPALAACSRCSSSASSASAPTSSTRWPTPGGQCTELYPDKPIYDIPALPVCGAQELVDRLHAADQALPPHVSPRPGSHRAAQARGRALPHPHGRRHDVRRRRGRDRRRRRLFPAAAHPYRRRGGVRRHLHPLPRARRAASCTARSS